MRNVLYRWNYLAIVAILFLFLVSSCQSFKKSESLKDVILITLDTTRADHLGCYGYQDAQTPNLDAFAEESIVFKNAISHSPTTVPSHSTILTGLYPPKHGVRVTGHHFFPKDLETLPDLLKKHHFRTAAVISGYPLTRKFGLDKGFDYYEDSFWNEFQNPPILERKAKESIEIAIRWLQQNKGAQFFLWLHLWDPHAAYKPPPPFDTPFSERPYDGEIAYMDWSLGSFFRKLKEWKIYDQSLIIIAGDHGEGLGDHDEAEHQYYLYDSTIRVPLLLHAGNEMSHKIITEEVGLVDIFPTILDYLHIDYSSSLDGQSLKPLIVKKEERPQKRSFYMEALSGQIALGWSPMYGIRKGGWKFIEAPISELYNLMDDPQEKNNLADLKIQKKEELKKELQQLRKELEEREREPEGEIDEETLRNLASLGYVSSGSYSIQRSESDKDPKKFLTIEKDINILARLFSEKKSSQIFPYINRILKVDPENKLALLYAGIAYYERNNYNRALPYLEKLIELYPDHESGREFLIRIYSSKKEWDKAMTICNVGLDYFPGHHKFYLYKGLILANMERCLEAIEYFQKAVEIKSDLPEVHYYLARCYVLVGQEDLAIQSIEQSLQKGIQNPRVYLIDPLFKKMHRFRQVQDLLKRYRII